MALAATSTAPPVPGTDRAPPWDEGASQAPLVAGGLPRLWTTLMRGRVFIALVLLLLQVFIHLQAGSGLVPVLLCTLYLAVTTATLLWTAATPQTETAAAPRWLLVLATDLAVFALLQWQQQGGINFTPLLVLPVLMGSILGPLLIALGSAAAATLVLLNDAWWSALREPSMATARFLQGGLTGTGIFLVAILANQLAVRLARAQALAATSQARMRSQTEVNELIVSGLDDGVVVVDARGEPWHLNGAAVAMLDDFGPTPSGPGWQALRLYALGCHASGQGGQTEVAWTGGDGSLQRLLARAQLTRPAPATPDDAGSGALCVVFLQDLREVEARMRTEKLAAMGRLSAAVAHEIRNPLAAITQANDLLREDAQDPMHRQLTDMIGNQAQRLARTVDDILDLTRADAGASAWRAAPLPVDAMVRSVVGDWLAQSMGAAQSDRLLRMRLAADGWLTHFDPEHLRRVLVNLLDNALRHVPGHAGALSVSTTVDAGTAVLLRVWSEGAPIDASIQRHLFEPFFSSDSRSSGLGLYICRELCERYGADIGWQRLTVEGREGNAFTVRLPASDAEHETAAPRTMTST